jgi:glucose/arabinose dehydrogenase
VHSVAASWIGVSWFALASVASAQTLTNLSLRAETVASGLSLPTTMAFIGPDDILVLQKDDGRVRRIMAGVLQPGEVLDVAVDYSSERGLLGIAVHPDFAAMDPYVYLYYTESGSSTDSPCPGCPGPLGNRVYRYTWDGSALTSPLLIADLPVTPGPNHDAGIITFGPDGKLYVIIGDLNRNGQLQNNAGGAPPDDTSVILRLNPDGTTPGDNPFAAQGGALARYYAYGIRNSFGMAFDPETGKLWDTENGASTYDEVNPVEPGFNSGWNKIMGPDARDPQGVGDLFVVPGSQYSDPQFSWFDTVAPTAIVFLDSAQLGAQYQNDAFVGDNNNGHLYRFRLNAGRAGFTFTDPGLADLVADSRAELDELIFGTGFGAITDLKVGRDGLLYVVSIAQGKIFRISAGQPDLLETVVTDPPATIVLKGKFSVTDTARNQGTVASGASTTRYYLSVDGVRSANDKRLTGKRSVPALAPGADSTGTVTVTVPSGVKVGPYFLLACADDKVVVMESVETNNCRPASMTVEVRAPDLVETAVSDPPASAAPAESFPVTDTVLNEGNAAAAGSTTRYYLSLDTKRNAGDTLLVGNRAVPGLDPGSSSSVPVTVTVPHGTPAGSYFLLACADDLKQIAESKEGNNCRASTGTVTVTP